MNDHLQVVLSDKPPLEDLGIDGARILKPGDAKRSILLQRMERKDAYGMPPLASALPDNQAVRTISSWIDSMDFNPECVISNADLDFSFPCAALENGDSFALQLNFADKLSQKNSDLLWRLDMNSIQVHDSCQSDACRIEPGLDLSISCLAYQDMLLGLEMEYVGGVPGDQKGHFWRLDLDSLKMRGTINSQKDFILIYQWVWWKGNRKWSSFNHPCGPLLAKNGQV